MTAGRVAITGADGQLGRQLVAAFTAAGWDVLGRGHGTLDITKASALEGLERWGPAVVVNAAAWTDVDGCARDPARALEINAVAAGRVAEMAARAGALAVQVSTNEVFDGTADRAYCEEDEPHPINPYGASKRQGEIAVVAANPRHLVIRTAWIFGPGGRNFPSRITEAARAKLAAGEVLRVVADEIGNPTWAPDLAAGIRHAVAEVLAGRLEPGFLHIAGSPPASRYDWARAVLAELPSLQLVPISAAEYPRPAPVPLRAVLDTSRAAGLGIHASDWRPATALHVHTLRDAVTS